MVLLHIHPLWRKSTAKNQKITFCGVGAHHQNKIIGNKNKMFTCSACMLLLQRMHMWPQMVDTMFWPFAFKVAAEQHNCLSLNKGGQTPISILQHVPSKTVSVKSFHTLCCPVYVLDSCTERRQSWSPKMGTLKSYRRIFGALPLSRRKCCSCF